MRNRKKYVPVSCAFYSELEVLAIRRIPCHIFYINEMGFRVEVHSIIRNLFTSSKEEFMELEQGILIRLDRLISINGKISRSYC